MTAVSVRPAVLRRPAASRVVVMRPAAGVGSGTAVTSTPVRLTRRGRAVVVGLLLNVAVAAAAVLLALAGSGAPADRNASTSTVVVQSGDTLWGIATRVDPHGDPRATMAELRRLNGLSGSTIEAGQELVLPQG
ncbi:MAG TPA: LysM peptidoglycan-binding domain-containing protein [Mycobacteriales bacterium]|jgi:LysM repeat protein